ncbi:MAG: MFS transporter [Solirubrobacteraceae bacterium]
MPEPPDDELWSLLLVGGRAADLLGRRRRLLSIGLSLFAAASLAAGLAQSSVFLIIARAVQGAAGAMVSPSALSLLTTMNAEGPVRNRALGDLAGDDRGRRHHRDHRRRVADPVPGVARDLP